MTEPRRLKWSRKAISDLKEIVNYIARDNCDAADIFADYVETIANDLAVSPIGRPGELAGTTERVLSRYPAYLLIFKYDDSHLNILRVFHTSQASKA